MDQDPVLCYIDRPWAYFTTQALDQQWGDDWNDAPYEHNAEEPYAKPGWEIVVVAFRSDLETPADRSGINSPYSVQDINEGQIPWLQTPAWDDGEQISIPAGTSLSEFTRIIRAAGGRVWREDLTAL